MAGIHGESTRLRSAAAYKTLPAKKPPKGDVADGPDISHARVWLLRADRAGAARLPAGAAAASATRVARAQAPAHRIDVHHHVMPPVWLGAVRSAGLDAPQMNSWTPEHSLADMDRAGVATAMLSVTQPAVGFLDAPQAASVTRAANEYTRTLADAHPGKFGLFAMLPMPHVDASLAEIAYALDTLKADGIGLLTSYGGKYLGHPDFAPVWDELNRRKALVFTHPNTPACCVNVAGLPPVYIEYGTDTTRTIANLIFSGASARLRDVNLVFSHAGGTLTSLTDRFLVYIEQNPKYKAFTGAGVLGELQRFFYDTAQAANPVAMAGLTKLVPTGQILFGTDYPYRQSKENVDGLAGVFGPDDLRLIERANALRLLPRWA